MQTDHVARCQACEGSRLAAVHADHMAKAPEHCLQGADGDEGALRAAVAEALQAPAYGPDGFNQHYVVGDAPSHMLATVDWRAEPGFDAILAALGSLREVRPRRPRVLC